MSTAPAVYRAINAVSKTISKSGIAKDRSNAQQGYKFRGIDDVYNNLAPIIADAGLVIIPRIVSREVTERTTAKGGVLFYVTVAAEFDFIAVEDGSQVTAHTYGEAMDSGDKATNKAMSAAYKYAAFQTFCIPTEGDNDADATTHVVVTPPTTTTAQGDTVNNVTGEVVNTTDGQLRIESVEQGQTKTGKNRWYLHLSDGRKACTFKQQFASLAENLCQDQSPVEVDTKEGKWGTDLVALRRATEEVEFESKTPVQAGIGEPPPWVDDVPF